MELGVSMGITLAFLLGVVIALFIISTAQGD